MNLSDFALKKTKAQEFIQSLNWVLANASVAPADRTAATELILGEIFANAAPLAEEGADRTAFFRATITPQVATLLNAVVELCTLDVEQVIKTTFDAWGYRMQVAYPRGNFARPCIGRYAEEFGPRHRDMVKAYPNLADGHWAIVDAFNAKKNPR